MEKEKDGEGPKEELPCVREVWASPAMIGVPNQRTRYFLLARRGADRPLSRDEELRLEKILSETDDH